MAEADFAAYLLARWPTLVRTLVLLGVEPVEADALARDTLARCHPQFDRVRREEDPDVHVYRRLLAAWWSSGGRKERDAYQHVGDAAVHDPTVSDPEARVLLLEALQTTLAEMSPEQRLVVVLRFAAGLDDQQVADVLELAPQDVASRRVAGLARLAPGSLLREHR